MVSVTQTRSGVTATANALVAVAALAAAPLEMALQDTALAAKYAKCVVALQSRMRRVVAGRCHNRVLALTELRAKLKCCVENSRWSKRVARHRSSRQSN